MRGATFPAQREAADAVISIHAPRVGRDFDCIIQEGGCLISIHAPRMGRDEALLGCCRETAAFQSTHPVRGATRRGGRCRPARRYFNPRTPCGARRRYAGILSQRGTISIHAPRVGRDICKSCVIFAALHFNPRTPCGVRQSTCSATATIWRSSETARAIRKRPRCRCALLRGRFAPRQTFFEEKTGTPVSGTDCIDYRILQKIGLPKRKTEQRSFPNMKATEIGRAHV